MDVQEIRSAFIASEALPEQIRRLRADRLAKIVADETLVPLNPAPKIVLHLPPVSSFVQRQTYDVASVNQGRVVLTPMGDSSGGASHSRYNLDGLLSVCEPRGQGACMYTQLYRDGRIEAVDALLIQASGDRKAFGRGFEQFIVDSMVRYLAVQRVLGVETPIIATLTFLRVRGYTVIGAHGPSPWCCEDGIDRDDLIMDEAVIEDFDCTIERVMRPVFDAVWMACGWPGSKNYDAQGNWKPPR